MSDSEGFSTDKTRWGELLSRVRTYIAFMAYSTFAQYNLFRGYRIIFDNTYFSGIKDITY